MTRPTRQSIDNRLTDLSSEGLVPSAERNIDRETARRLRAIVEDAPDAPINISPEERAELREIVTPAFEPAWGSESGAPVESDISPEAAHAIRVAELGRGNA